MTDEQLKSAKNLLPSISSAKTMVPDKVKAVKGTDYHPKNFKAKKPQKVLLKPSIAGPDCKVGWDLRKI